MNPSELKNILEKGPEESKKLTMAAKVGYLLGVLMAFLAMVLVLWLSWNWVMPQLGVAKIDFLGSLCLLLIFNILIRPKLKN